MSNKSLVTATINGEEKQFLCEPRQSLLEALRDVLYLTGTKEGCNDGNCGGLQRYRRRRIAGCLLHAGRRGGGQQCRDH